MIQLFFFISMITLAALLMNLFWYISDSHEMEYRIIHSSDFNKNMEHSNWLKKPVRKSGTAFKKPISKINTISHKAREYDYRIDIVRNIDRGSFIDVGTPEDDYKSNLNKQADCA